LWQRDSQMIRVDRHIEVARYIIGWEYKLGYCKINALIWGEYTAQINCETS